MDTIYALASAKGKSGVAVIRISGPEACSAASSLAGDLPGSHVARLRVLKNQAGEILDQALVLVFEEGRSFTGEEVVEFHVHGSTAVIDAVLQALGQMDGLRQAEAGEFTRRALENDRLDLAQIEGLADLLEAETDAQRRQAMQVFSGALGKLIGGWRRKLVRAASLVEASIDFSEEDVPDSVFSEAESLVLDVCQELQKEVAGVGIRERIRDGFEVAIIGPPNAGKSTLLNALAGRDAALISDIAGTTRDIIEVRMDVGGYPVTMLDTAGLRESDNEIEGLGVKRAVERARAADLRIFLGDIESRYSGLEVINHDIRVIPKGDLLGNPENSISGKTGHGIDHLAENIKKRLDEMTAHAATATRDRHRKAMQQAVGCLEKAVMELRYKQEHAELAAFEIRTAIRSLESLVGRVDVESFLDEIFSSFCIGK